MYKAANIDTDKALKIIEAFRREEILLKAKPILFNTDMIRAILDGRKTVTRRIVKNNPEECTSKVVNGVCKICDDKGGFYLPDDYVKARSPYQVGDILYVRETWGISNFDVYRFLCEAE